MNPVLRVEGVEVRFGKQRALSDVSFDVPVGEVTGLIGANGAGKSTLIRTILGLERMNAGDVFVDDLSIKSESQRVRRNVGYVPDHPDVYPWMKLSTYLSFLRPQYPSWSDQIVQKLTERFGLCPNRKFAQYSRGEAVKAMLVGALAIQPKLLLLDEPFSALDPGARDEILRVLIEEAADSNCSILVATHDLHMAARIADRVLFLDNGSIQLDGTIDDVLIDTEASSRIPKQLKGLFETAEINEEVHA